MRRATWSVICIVPLLFGSAFGGIFGEIEDLKGMFVAEAGELEDVPCPPYGKYDCGNWPLVLLKFRLKDVCFTSDPGACGYSCKGLLAVSEDKTIHFFEFEQIGGGIKKHSAKPVQCPSLY